MLKIVKRRDLEVFRMLDNGKGLLFSTAEAWRVERKRKTHNLNIDFNKLYEDQTQERQAILREILGELNEGVFIQGPITFHYGIHTKIGKGTFINFNFTCQDDAFVTIGENCNFGPNVTIVTPMHPMISSERLALRTPDGKAKRLCWAKPVNIGNGCWFGANVVVCPGVTIGGGCVIGAGSVVTHDIPSNTFAAGNPCRVIREITQADSLIHHPVILGDCGIIP